MEKKGQITLFICSVLIALAMLSPVLAQETPLDLLCQQHGFDYGIAFWRCFSSSNQITAQIIAGAATQPQLWQLMQEIVPGTSVIGTCYNFQWDADSTGAAGIVLNSSNNGSRINGTNGTLSLYLPASTLAFCGNYPSCGNGIVSAGELCDDGNTISADGCSSTCQPEYCGDGIIQAALGELCDDGNIIPADGCTDSCRLPACGDGIIQAALGELCDDGNIIPADGCTDSCRLPACGDGIIQAALGEL